MLVGQALQRLVTWLCSQASPGTPIWEAIVNICFTPDLGSQSYFVARQQNILFRLVRSSMNPSYAIRKLLPPDSDETWKICVALVNMFMAAPNQYVYSGYCSPTIYRTLILFRWLQSPNDLSLLPC